MGRHGIQRAEHLGQIHNVVGIEEGNAVLEPLFAVFRAQIFRAVLLGDVQNDLQLSGDDLLVAFQRQVQEGAALLKADDLLDDGDGLRLVEQTHDGGLHRLHDLPAGLIAHMDVGEQERMVDAGLGLLDDLELGLGHDAQSPLGADEEGDQVGAGGVLRHGQGVDDIAVGQNHFQRQAHIVHLAVLGGENADAVVRQRAAHGAAGHAGGQVHHGIALFVDQIFQRGKNHAGLAGDEARLGVQLDELVQTLDVQQNAAGHRQSAALTSGAAAPCGDGNFIVVGDLHDLGYFLGGAGANDDIRHGTLLTGILPFPAEPEIVHGIYRTFNFLGGYVFYTDRVLQLGTDHVEHQRLVLHGASPFLIL